MSVREGYSSKGDVIMREDTKQEREKKAREAAEIKHRMASTGKKNSKKK